MIENNKFYFDHFQVMQNHCKASEEKLKIIIPHMSPLINARENVVLVQLHQVIFHPQTETDFHQIAIEQNLVNLQKSMISQKKNKFIKHIFNNHFNF